jgi:hypothetical protein
VSDRNSFDRRHLLTAAVAGLVGAATGYLIEGRRKQDSVVGDAPPAAAPKTAAAKGPGADYKWTLTVQGGYAWWFKTTGGKTSVSLLALDTDKCTCVPKSQCIDHPMLLIAFANKVELGSGTTYQPVAVGNMLWWRLEGATEFIKGMPGDGISETPGTKWTDLQDPYGPQFPDDVSQWDDQVWLPERMKAKTDAESYAATAFLLTDGTLAVRPPRNLKAKAGRWMYKGGTAGRKALTDVLELSGHAQDEIGIRTKGGDIFLKPKTGQMGLWIRHMAEPGTTVITEGQPPPHYAQLFDFVDGQNCKSADLPVFELRKDVKPPAAEGLTPGDLCPPVILN